MAARLAIIAYDGLAVVVDIAGVGILKKAVKNSDDILIFSRHRLFGDFRVHPLRETIY